MVEVRQVLNTIAITYAIAIVLTLVLGILTMALKTAFPEFTLPFTTTYNAVRSLTLFMLIFPVALSLILIGFFGDLAINFVVPVINILFGFSEGTGLPTTIGGQTLMEIVGSYNPTTGIGTGVLGQLIVLVNSIFPAL